MGLDVTQLWNIQCSNWQFLLSALPEDMYTYLVLLSMCFMTLARLNFQNICKRLGENWAVRRGTPLQTLCSLYQCRSEYWVSFVLSSLECTTTGLATLLSCHEELQAQTTLWNRACGGRGAIKKGSLRLTGCLHILIIKFFYMWQN